MKLSWIMLIGGALLVNSVHSKQKKYVTVPIVCPEGFGGGFGKSLNN